MDLGQVSDAELYAAAGLDNPAAHASDAELYQAAGITPPGTSPLKELITHLVYGSNPSKPGGEGSGPYGLPTGPEVVAQTSAAMGKIPAWLGGAVLPAGATALGAAAYSGGWNALQAADTAVRQHVAQSGRAGLPALYDGITSLNVEDAKTIGMQALLGATVGAAGHGATTMLAGPVNAERVAATQKLTTAGEIPPRTMAQGGRDLSAFLRDTAKPALPQPNVAATDAAYDALRAEQSPRGLLDATPIRDVLAEHAAQARVAGFQVPKALDGTTLPESPTIDQVLTRMSTINTLMRQKALGPEPNLPGAQLRQLSADLYDVVARQLSPTGRILLEQASNARSAQAELDALQSLIRTGAQQGVPQGPSMVNALLNRDANWQGKLGSMYPEALKWAQAVTMLQAKPEGRLAFQALTGAAIGAGIGATGAEMFGGSPEHGAGYGAITGLLSGVGLGHTGVGSRVVNAPLFLSLTERLARARGGTEQLTATLGRALVAMHGATLVGAEQPGGEQAPQNTTDQIGHGGGLTIPPTAQAIP